MQENDQIENIKKTLEEHERRIAELEKLNVSKPYSSVAQKKLSIKEFILSKNPKDHIQKTLAIGYYLEKSEGLSSFKAKDLEKGFQEAKEKAPGNINYNVIKNIEKGHIMESREKKDKRKAWNLTNTGEKFVENDFNEK